MGNITLNVKDMSCQHCVKAVEGSVGQLEGVKKVSVKLAQGLVDVEFDPKLVSLGTIKETIDDQGYDVE